MTITISPFLKNQLDSNRTNNNNDHEEIYKNLKQHANDVKPNEPKAKLVRENAAQKVFSAAKDNFNDGKNFFKAVRTGKMNDNSLGRINDLGMKAGAILIATFLATKAKTKTEAIMQFVGGTTFFASMALWPKIFINLPARIIHGFPIDEKYISAQGDKKDIHLDNQFIPTGIHSEKQKKQEMKRMGIDPNEKNAEEKWLRKRQKTALQNRTLWMATAGFATPLMTALIGNYVQPKIENAVIEHEFRKASNILMNNEALNAYFIKQQDIRNVENIEDLFKGKKNSTLDNDFFKKLARLLEIGNLSQEMKYTSDWHPLLNLKSNNLTEALKKVYEKTSTIDIDSLKSALGNVECFTSSIFSESAESKLSKEEIEEIIENLGDNKTINNLIEILKDKGNIGDEQISDIIKEIKINNENFFNAIRDYNKNILSRIRGRIKAYLSLLNPIMGKKAESVYTRQYGRMMSKITQTFGITNYETLKKIKEDNSLNSTIRILRDKIKSFIKQDTDYEKGLHDFIELTEEYINNGRDDSSFKQALESTFGANFPLLNGTENYVNFKENIKSPSANPDKKTWLIQIYERFCAENANAPKRNSINLLNIAGLNEAEKRASEEIGKTSTLMKIFTITPSDETYFKKLDNFINAIYTYIDSKNTNIDEAKTILREKLKNILGDSAQIVANDNEFNNFITYITTDNRTWISEIIDNNSTDSANQILTNAILRGKRDVDHLFNQFSRYIKNKNIDLDYTRVKALICANFERRFIEGCFDGFKENEIQAMINYLYDGTISDAFNKLRTTNNGISRNIIEAVFNKDVFQLEEKIAPGISEIVESMKTLNNEFGKYTEKSLKVNSFGEQLKTYATRLYNNKTWMKIFAPMAIGLVAVTLLAQPFFGKIKKEFPDDKKSGGVK